MRVKTLATSEKSEEEAVIVVYRATAQLVNSDTRDTNEASFDGVCAGLRLEPLKT